MIDFQRRGSGSSLPPAHANHVILCCVIRRVQPGSCLLLLLSIFHVSASAAILGAPSDPPPTGCQNIIFQHSPAIFFVTVPLPRACSRSEAVLIAMPTPGPLFAFCCYKIMPATSSGELSSRVSALFHLYFSFSRAFVTSGEPFSRRKTAELVFQYDVMHCGQQPMQCKTSHRPMWLP